MSDFAKNLRTIREAKAIRREDIARKIGVTYGTISNYENGVSEPSIDQLAIIAQVLDVSIDQLVLAKKLDIVEEDYVAYQSAGIPLLPFGASETNFMGRFVIPGVTADFLVQVPGVSMLPNYRSGDMVACNVLKVSPPFQWGRAFVIHHRHQGMLFKRLFPTDSDSCVECRSDNSDYPPFTINTSDIDQFAMVVALIRPE